jgi:hypothetical protein
VLVPKGSIQNQEHYGENRHSHDLRPYKSLCKIYAVTQAAKKACLICRRGEMEQLNHIVHDDQSITIYWRCPICSHVQVMRTEAVLDPHREPKFGRPKP